MKLCELDALILKRIREIIYENKACINLLAKMEYICLNTSEIHV